MHIYRDIKIFDSDFPFEIHNIQVSKADNRIDTFHWHDFCEITYVQEGKGNYFVNGKQYDMSSGDLIIFNNVEPHGWQVHSDYMQLLVMVFPIDLVSSLNSDYLFPFIKRGSNFKNKIDSNEPLCQKIALMMKEIFKEYHQKSQGYQLLITADVMKILTFLIRLYQKNSTIANIEDTLADKKNNMKRIMKAFDYINEHYTEKITLNEVAKSVFMSNSYFCTYFKKVANKSFIDYVTDLRLKKVNELMKTTDMTMLEIAAECGFNNMSNFYRLYKKHMGILPDRKYKHL